MKKSLLLIAAIVISVFAANAQQKSYENVTKLDKEMSGNCVSIDVVASLKDAQNVMEKLLKSNRLDGKSSCKKLTYEKIVFPEISTDYINMFVTFEPKSKSKANPVTKVNVFVQKGISTTFESSNTDGNLILNLRNFLDTKYSQAIHDNDVALKIASQTKDIKKTQKEINKLESQMKKRTKDISTYEKNIEKAKNDIEKLKKDIENQKQLIEKQNAALKEIK